MLSSDYGHIDPYSMACAKKNAPDRGAGTGLERAGVSGGDNDAPIRDRAREDYRYRGVRRADRVDQLAALIDPDVNRIVCGLENLVGEFRRGAGVIHVAFAGARSWAAAETCAGAVPVAS